MAACAHSFFREGCRSLWYFYLGRGLSRPWRPLPAPCPEPAGAGRAPGPPPGREPGSARACHAPDLPHPLGQPLPEPGPGPARHAPAPLHTRCSAAPRVWAPRGPATSLTRCTPAARETWLRAAPPRPRSTPLPPLLPLPTLLHAVGPAGRLLSLPPFNRRCRPPPWTRCSASAGGED